MERCLLDADIHRFFNEAKGVPFEMWLKYQ